MKVLEITIESIVVRSLPLDSEYSCSFIDELLCRGLIWNNSSRAKKAAVAHPIINPNTTLAKHLRQKLHDLTYGEPKSCITSSNSSWWYCCCTSITSISEDKSHKLSAIVPCWFGHSNAVWLSPSSLRSGSHKRLSCRISMAFCC